MPQSAICVFCRRSLNHKPIAPSRLSGLLSTRRSSTAATSTASNPSEHHQSQSQSPFKLWSPAKNRKNRVQPRHDQPNVSAAERIRIALGQGSRELFPKQSIPVESRSARSNAVDNGGTRQERQAQRGAARINKTVSRLGNVHSLDELMKEVFTALQTYTGLYELRHSLLALSKAITRCRQYHTAAEVHSAFNLIKVALLSRGFPVLELLPIELSCVEATGSVPALMQVLRAAKGVPGYKILPAQMERLFDLVAEYGTSKAPTAWDGIKVAGWKRRQSIGLLFGNPLTDLGTSADERSNSSSKTRSLRSLVNDKNIDLLCAYIRALGKLNANHEIWSEWRTSRYLVVPWKPDAKVEVESQEDSQRLLLVFIEAFIACRDLRSVWVLLERVRQRNPAAITPEIWAAILRYEDSKTTVPVKPDIGAISTSTRWPGLVNEVTRKLVEGGQTSILSRLAKSSALLTGESRIVEGSDDDDDAAADTPSSSNRQVWQAWADGVVGVAGRSTEDCLPAVEQCLSGYKNGEASERL